MSVLTKRKFNRMRVRTRVNIEPYDPVYLEESGYKLRVGERVFRLKGDDIDIKEKQDYTTRKIGTTGTVLKPGEVYLIETLECVGIREKLGIMIPLQDAARKGIKIESGYVDSGFMGHLLVAVSVVKPTRIHKGIPFVKIGVYDLPLADKRTKYEGNFHLPETKSYEEKE